MEELQSSVSSRSLALVLLSWCCHASCQNSHLVPLKVKTDAEARVLCSTGIAALKLQKKDELGRVPDIKDIRVRTLPAKSSNRSDLHIRL